MKRKMLMVVNPVAGKGKIGEELMEILQLFCEKGWLPTVLTTSAEDGQMSRLRKVAGQYDLVVCAGGDGTLSGVINALLRDGYQLPLGYLPAGTTNDFAATLGLPRDPLEAARIVMEGRRFHCDVGTFNGRYFSYVAAFGAFTEVVYRTSQQAKSTLGRMAYILEAIKSIPDIRDFHITGEYDGRPIEGDYILGMVTNATSIGGFRTSSSLEVALDDGMLEVHLVRRPHDAAQWQTVINTLLSQQLDLNFVDTFKTGCMTLQSEKPRPWTLDGEYGGTVAKVQIGIRKQALAILVPPRQADPE